jgi:hypothetical protein
MASYNEDSKFCSVSSTTQYKVWCVSISLKISALVLKFNSLSLFSDRKCLLCCVLKHAFTDHSYA